MHLFFIKQFGVFAVGDVVHFGNGRTGDDVVELVCKHHLPHFFKPPAWILHTAKFICKHKQFFKILQRIFRSAIVTLVFGYRCVRSAVIFQIQLARPTRQLGVIVHLFRTRAKKSDARSNLV